MSSINSVSDTDVQALKAQIEAQQFDAVKDVKLIKAAQESMETVGSIIQDTVEISNEAMNKFMSEKA